MTKSELERKGKNYAVRIFGLQDITILDTTSGATNIPTLNKGEISTPFYLNDCNDPGLIITSAEGEDPIIDFCGENVTPGKSYLLVISDNNVLLAAEEK